MQNLMLMNQWGTEEPQGFILAKRFSWNLAMACHREVQKARLLAFAHLKVWANLLKSGHIQTTCCISSWLSCQVCLSLREVNVKKRYESMILLIFPNNIGQMVQSAHINPLTPLAPCEPGSLQQKSGFWPTPSWWPKTSLHPPMRGWWSPTRSYRRTGSDESRWCPSNARGNGTWPRNLEAKAPCGTWKRIWSLRSSIRPPNLWWSKSWIISLQGCLMI